MAKKLGSIMVFVLGAVLLAYSASRSLNFIELTLPADQKGLAYFGLAALDGGLIGWTLSYLKGSKGWQRAIALIMAMVDLIGVIGMFTMDTLYNSGEAGLTKAMDAQQMTNAVLAMSVIIGLNIAATIFHHMVDPESLREQAEEEAFDRVESATLKQIARNAEQLAAQLAPTLAADWMRQTQARYMANIGTAQVGKILDLPAQDVTPAPMAMPIIAAQPQENKFNFGALWSGLFKNADGRKYEFVSPVTAVAKQEATATDGKSFTAPALKSE
jgi:hypothetical protein